jgi:cytochrome c biogenesis protein CcmG/thiol:disulfide interchange protein DsbE
MGRRSKRQPLPRPQHGASGRAQPAPTSERRTANWTLSSGRWRSSLTLLAITATVALGLVAVVHAVASGTEQGASAANTSASSSVSSGAVGSQAPAFTLTTLTGAPFTLASAHGHPVVLYFMATTCSSCVQGSAELAQAAQSAHVAGAQVVAIDVNAGDTRSELASFAQSTGVPASAPMIWGVDSNDSITRAYGVIALETTVVVNAQGRIAYESPGPVAPPQLVQLLQKAA